MAGITNHQSPITNHPRKLRACLYLVWLSWVRQSRLGMMVWISLALLAAVLLMVVAWNAKTGWGRVKRPNWKQLQLQSDEEVLRKLYVASALAAPLGSPAATAAQGGVLASVQAARNFNDSIFYNFSDWIVFGLYVNFLLPLWSLSFATEALGGERESHSLLWLLTRPLPRWAIYLAKLVAVLPWMIGLNLGGFALLCLAGGRPGPMALKLYWPAILSATLAFAALFHLFGACFRRPTIIALVYSFFLETILGNMPGYLKRISVGFYTRCMMYEAAQHQGVQPEKPSVYLPVDGLTALAVLLGLSLILVGLGMLLFSRREYVAIE
jgi:hypothetical protein